MSLPIVNSWRTSRFSSLSSLVNAKTRGLNIVRTISTTSSLFSQQPPQPSSSSSSPSISSTRSVALFPALSPSSGPLPIGSVESTSSALSLLKSQPDHYVISSIAGRTFLLTTSDIVTVPRLRDVEIGDVLLLDRIHELGSRDYTLRAQPSIHCRKNSQIVLQKHSFPLATSSWSTKLIPKGLAHLGKTLSSKTVTVTAVVLENTIGPLETTVKFKKRKGYKKTIRHKQTYTRLRIESIQIHP